MPNFDGKVALITGASSGIGEGTAVHLASLGCWLSLTSRNMVALEAVAERCRAEGVPKDKVLTTRCDVRCAEDIAAVVKRTAEHFGKIDVVINNAGIGTIAHLEEFSLQQFDDVIHTNLRSAFIMTQETLPYLQKTKGNIVNVSSVVSLRTVRHVAPYSISKAGLDQLTQVSALGKLNIIGSNHDKIMVSPAITDTKMVFGHIKNVDDKKQVECQTCSGVSGGLVNDVC
ncbi:uncharacterized oxidoreductase SERP2049 [Rhipicephalus sanguineus]|uniref:uncharacterized oxidoreductase SERP2049 n=1 Tax=Rhipicephalus sanguineus TaxID=34632 RepID=UPI0020C2D3DC|nr:uncharacterized oxidoreductase SERP2049 [Rhipicephalus sanguineus]